MANDAAMSDRRTCVFWGGKPLTLEHNPPQWLDEFCEDMEHGRTTAYFKDQIGTRPPAGSARTVANAKVQKCESYAVAATTAG